MAELVQLDKAAALVGRSEVTLRRLVKAGKIPFQKEKTLTGFIYLVDAEAVRAHYGLGADDGFAYGKDDEGAKPDQEASGQESPAEEIPVQKPEKKESDGVAIPVAEDVKPNGSVRVAVATDSSTVQDYWRKRSERYEDKYLQELSQHSQTREELGVWRGRAEQSQSMLLKMLPSPQDIEVKDDVPATVQRPEPSSVLWTAAVAILGLVALVLAAGVAWLAFGPK